MTAAGSPPLTTDYLNHFGGFVMMLELLPAAPQMIDELLAWRPLTYREHIERIAFAAVDPLRRGYQELDAARRLLLDGTAEVANALAADIVAQLAQAREAPDRIDAIVKVGRGAMRAHIAALAAILSGRPLSADAQEEIDALIAGAAEPITATASSGRTGRAERR